MDSKPQRRIIPIKPERSSLSSGDHAAVIEVCTRLKMRAGALMPILHGIQEALGHVPEGAVPLVARELNLSVAEVHGVVTFYHYFRRHPPGRHVVHLCRAEACQAVGAPALEAHAKQTLGVEFHATTPDGAITLEPVYCLGNCALGPSIMIDDRLQGRVTPNRFDELMLEARADARSME